MRTQVKNQQRSVADRTDVLTFTTPVLTTAMRIRGAPVVDLFAATSGADSDWVVKLIDVFPDEVPNQPSRCAIPCARGPSRASAIGIPKSRIFSMPSLASNQMPQRPALQQFHGAYLSNRRYLPGNNANVQMEPPAGTLAAP